MKSFFKVTILSAALTFLRMIAGFIIGKIVAVYTGPGGVAMLGQLQSLVSISNGIITSPVGSGLVKYTSESHEQGVEHCAKWWRASVFVALCFFAIYIPLVLVFSEEITLYLFNNANYEKIVIFSCFTIPFSTANVLLASVLNGQEQYRRYITSGMISVIASTILVVIFVPVLHLEAALFIVASGTAIAGSILILCCINMSWLKLTYFFGRVERDKLIKIFQYTLMILVSAVCMPLAILMLRNSLVKYAGWDAAGLWQAVWKISEVYLAVITIALSTYVLPKLSKLGKTGLIKREVNTLIRVVLPVTAVLALGIYLSRDLIIKILFTPDFESARDLFLFQLVGDVIKIAGFVYAYPMLAKAKAKVFIISEIFFGISLFLLSHYFIKTMGVQGANIGYLVNYVMYFVFCFSYTNFIMKDSSKEIS